MIMKIGVMLYYDLYELYLDSIQAKIEPSFGQAASREEPKPWNGKLAYQDMKAETELNFQGGIHVLSLWGNLISFLVVQEFSDSRFQALKVSPFTEFAAQGDLILKAFGGNFVALTENSFILRKSQILESITLDGVGAFDLMKAQDFIEEEHYRKQRKLLHSELPKELRDRFVDQEFDLSCELRAMSLTEDGFLKIPHLLEDKLQLQPAECISYSLCDKSIPPRLEIVGFMTIPSKLPDGTRKISWIDGKGFEIIFSLSLVGKRCEVRLSSVLVFRGILPERLLLNISVDSVDLAWIRKNIKLHPLH